MGQPKLTLPWGGSTVLGQVLSTFAAAGIEDILVVTGGARDQIEKAVSQAVDRVPIRTTYNPDHGRSGMLSSIQCGLTEQSSTAFAALIALGDQPQVRVETIQRISNAFFETNSPLVIPSFQGRRGHPWLVARYLWPEILALPASITPRQFLSAHAGQIEYVLADKSTLQDLDTPEDYDSQRP